MDNLDDSENNAKVSDSAYSNSCSNSQSRRSHSSKSSGSGSSGYGGKPSTSSSNDLSQPSEKRCKDKEGKKKKPQVENSITEINDAANQGTPQTTTFENNQLDDIPETAVAVELQPDSLAPDNNDLATTERISSIDVVNQTTVEQFTSQLCLRGDTSLALSSERLFCVVSVKEGVILYSTEAITTTLGYPPELWNGRSFLDFVHVGDQDMFATQIKNGCLDPQNGYAQNSGTPVVSVCCRIRKFNGIETGFNVRSRLPYMVFDLKLSYQNVMQEVDQDNCLVVQARPLYPAFKGPCEIMANAVPFTIRHLPNGNLEYIDINSVPYLGYLPKDLLGKDVFILYHEQDLFSLVDVYNAIARGDKTAKTTPIRMRTHNGDFLKVETEWSKDVNPWSKKLECIIGKHIVVEGPSDPDVFQTAKPSNNSEQMDCLNEIERKRSVMMREHLIQIINKVPKKSMECAKTSMTERCQDLASVMENLMDDHPKPEEELKVDVQEQYFSYYERDSVMLGGVSPHHDFNDTKATVNTPISYNQLNYDDNMQRYFDRYETCSYEEFYKTGEFVAGPARTTKYVGVPAGATPSRDSGDFTSSSESGVIESPRWSTKERSERGRSRFSVSALAKHNIEMTNNLAKQYIDNRSKTKEERENKSFESIQKMEHLARCNASFQPTMAGVPIVMENKDLEASPRMKRTRAIEGPYQTRPSGHRERRRRAGSRAPSQADSYVSSHAGSQVSSHADSHVTSHAGSHVGYHAASQAGSRAGTPPYTTGSPVIHINSEGPRWTINTQMTAYPQNVGMSQPMSFLSPVGMPGIFPMYYMPTLASNNENTMPTADVSSSPVDNQNTFINRTPHVQYMMYPPPVFGTPYMYPSVPFAQYNPSSAQFDPQATQFDPQATQYDQSATQYNPTATQYDTPALKYELPALQYESPTTQNEQPARQYESPATPNEKPARQYESPDTQYKQPARQYESPDTLYKQPARQYESPARQYESPDTQYKQSPRLYDSPATQCKHSPRNYESPATQYKQPPKQYESTAKQYKHSPRQYESPALQYKQPPKQYESPAPQYKQAPRQYEPPAPQYKQAPRQYEPPAAQYDQPARQYEPPAAQYDQSASQYEPPAVLNQYNTPHSPMDITSNTYDESSMTIGNSAAEQEKAGGEKTDGESSYSSFYSSFLKTDFSSADEMDTKKPSKSRQAKQQTHAYDSKGESPSSGDELPEVKRVKPSRRAAKRKQDAPWLDQVYYTSDLQLKYKLPSKGLSEILRADYEKIQKMEQPDLVNEQLGQLYQDLQIQGAASKLTLDEGVSSGGSSGEETSGIPKRKKCHRMDDFNISMIYEEDAPMPLNGESLTPDPWS